MPFSTDRLFARGYWDTTDGDGTTSTGGSSDASDVSDSTSNTTDVNESVDVKQEDRKSDNKPSESEAKLLKEVMNKKAKIKELESTLDSMKGQLGRFDGIDPDEVKALLKEKSDAEQSKLEAKGEWEALKKRMAEEHKSEKQKLQEQVESFQALLNQKSELVEKLTLGHEFDNSKFIREDLVLTPRKAKAVYGDHFSIDENGNVIGFDGPASKKDRSMLVDSSGDPLPFEEAIRRLIEADPDKDELLRSKKRPGAGSATQTAKGVGESARRLSAREKIELGLKAS